MHIAHNIVHGERVASPTTFESRSPSTGEVLGLVPVSTREQVAAAVAAAKAAQPAWAALPDAERQARVARVAEGIGTRAAHLA